MPDTSPSAIPTGTVRALSFHSEALQADWNYIVYEPPGYETGALRYPACYLLHGNFGAPRDYIDAGDLPATADRLIAEGKTRPAVIAMPDGGQSWYLNHEATRMEDAILGEFIPHIEKTERVIASRAARRIGGISMGGYGSLRYALKRPELFAAVALMSPAIYADLPHEGSSAWHGAPFCAPRPAGGPVFVPAAWHAQAYPTMIDACPPGPQPKFYIESGAQDEYGIADEARRLHEAFISRGRESTFGLRPGTHDWTTWKAALETALPFLLGDAPAPTPAETA